MTASREFKSPSDTPNQPADLRFLQRHDLWVRAGLVPGLPGRRRSIKSASPVNRGSRIGLITLVQTFHRVFHLRGMSPVRPLYRLVPDDRSNQERRGP
jgi:hypothetical protein